MSSWLRPLFCIISSPEKKIKQIVLKRLNDDHWPVSGVESAPHVEELVDAISNEQLVGTRKLWKETDFDRQGHRKSFPSSGGGGKKERKTTVNIEGRKRQKKTVKFDKKIKMPWLRPSCRLRVAGSPPEGLGLASWGERRNVMVIKWAPYSFGVTHI